MDQTEFNKKQVVKYLIWTFVTAWLMQAGVAVLALKGYTLAYQALMALMMFCPLLGVLLSGYSLKNIGWKPRFKGNVKPLLFAWFSPSVLTAVGALLYFAVFSSHFDISGAYLTAAAGEDALRQLEAQGLTYPLYILITAVTCLTYTPALNMFFSVGEEAGWRGFLCPQLKARFGSTRGRLIAGVIWGIWHWPIIWLIGYEYGMDYIGFPVVGVLLFCVITIGLGILCDWLYEKSRCIWIPAIFHGSFNAAATIPFAVCILDTGSARLLGPSPVGLLAGAPLLVFAAILLLRPDKTEKQN